MSDEEIDDAITLLALRGLKTTTKLPFLWCFCGGELGGKYCSACGVDRETSEDVSRLIEKAFGWSDE